MSTAPLPTDPTLPRNVLAENWGWFVGLGLALTVLGFIGLGEAFAVTLGAVWFFGVLLLAGGVMHVVHAFYNRAWGGFFLELLVGFLYVIAGIDVVNDPITGAAILTLLLGAVFLINGITRIVLALTHLRYPGAYVLLLGGFISMFLGGSILARWPGSSLYIIGLFVSLELILAGVSWIALGLTAKQARTV
ncbi:MAG: HdeD family acid-resistance protein [Gemmataceae bacterium]